MNRITVKETTAKNLSNNVKKVEVYNISTGQYQSSLGLSGKTQIYKYCCKIINGSYMHGMTWYKGKTIEPLGINKRERATLYKTVPCGPLSPPPRAPTFLLTTKVNVSNHHI